MHSPIFKYESLHLALRWLARAGSLAVIGVLILFLVGEGRHSSVPIRARDLAGLALFPFGVVLGMIVSWKYEFEGSFLSIGSLIGFYIVCGVVVGNLPDGWAFLVFTSPAFLFLLSGVLERLNPHHHYVGFHHH